METSKPAGGKRGRFRGKYSGYRGNSSSGQQKGQELALAFTTLKSEEKLDDIFTADTPYFYVEIPDTSEKLVHKIESWFPLQFGRQVLASPDVLDDTKLIDWKRCVLNKEDETAATGEFRRLFSQFDPFVG